MHDSRCGRCVDRLARDAALLQQLKHALRFPAVALRLCAPVERLPVVAAAPALEGARDARLARELERYGEAEAQPGALGALNDDLRLLTVPSAVDGERRARGAPLFKRLRQDLPENLEVRFVRLEVSAATFRVGGIVKDVRGSESNCEQDSRKL